MNKLVGIIPVSLKKGTKVLGIIRRINEDTTACVVLECEYRKKRFDIVYYGKPSEGK
jgi:hypothetical protein